MSIEESIEYQGDPEWEAKVAQQEEQASKAFVALTVFMPYMEVGKQIAVISGFVFDVKGQWFLISAEHAFVGWEGEPGLDQVIATHPEVAITLQPFHQQGTTTGTVFRVDPEARFGTGALAEAWKDRVGDLTYLAMKSADIIAMPLSDYYEKNLAAVGVTPFTWDQVRNVSIKEATKLLSGQTVTARLMGVPATSVQSGETSFSAWHLRLPVEPAGEEPPFSYWNPTWDADRVPYDVKGTSGGPIVIFGADKPYVLAIQVAQDRVDGKRRLKGVCGYAFFEFLASWVDYLIEQGATQTAEN